MGTDRSFAQLVSLACHDLRTPLATVHGFARTIGRVQQLEPKTERYLELMVDGSGQMADLLERLALVARIERNAYEPALQEADTLELAQSAAERVTAGTVSVAGTGAGVRTDPAPLEVSLADLCTCAIRHGDADAIECSVQGAELRITPVSADSGPILLGEDLRDFGAASARMHVEALGGGVSVEGNTLLVRLAG